MRRTSARRAECTAYIGTAGGALAITGKGVLPPVLHSARSPELLRLPIFPDALSLVIRGISHGGRTEGDVEATSTSRSRSRLRVVSRANIDSPTGAPAAAAAMAGMPVLDRESCERRRSFVTGHEDTRRDRS